MPSPKRIALLLIASLALHTSLQPAHAAQDPVALTATAEAALKTPPDEARIATDLKAHSQIANLSSLTTTPDLGLRADHTSIRSSVRKGDVLEFHVTSLHYAEAQSAPQREVDSLVSYQMTSDGWRLREVTVTDTRETRSNRRGSTTEPC